MGLFRSIKNNMSSSSSSSIIKNSSSSVSSVNDFYMIQGFGTNINGKYTWNGTYSEDKKVYICEVGGGTGLYSSYGQWVIDSGFFGMPYWTETTSDYPDTDLVNWIVNSGDNPIGTIRRNGPFYSSSSESSLSESSLSSPSSSSSIFKYSSSTSSSSSSSIIENKKIPILCTWNNYIFAAEGKSLLRSLDRFHWDNIFKTDSFITALFVSDNSLYIGDNKGNIYIMDLNKEIFILDSTLSGSISGFINYDKLYVFTSYPCHIYNRDLFSSKWILFYSPYFNEGNKSLIFNNNLMLFGDKENFIIYSSSLNKWSINPFVENISSIRTISPDIKKRVNTFNSRDKYQKETVSPINSSKGISSADIDGYSLVLGSSNSARVYNFINNAFVLNFQTEGKRVNYLLNLQQGVNLAAIGSKVYLLHTGNIEDIILTPTTTTTTTTSMPEIFTITSPNRDSFYSLGDTISVLWSSDKGLNDATKIELYKGSVLTYTINPKTTNSGSYDWIIPASLPEGSDYTIVLTWLSSNITTANSTASQQFTITINPTTTTTTTTLPHNTQIPDLTQKRGIPILDLVDEEVIFMMKDAGNIIFTTNKGRIIQCEAITLNAYLTGKRNIYAQVKNGFRNTSDTTQIDFLYSLYKRIFEINESKEVIWKHFNKNNVAIKEEDIIGVFESPLLKTNEDFGNWKDLIWEENDNSNKVIITIRSGNTESELLAATWDNSFQKNGLITTKDLSSLNLKKWLQFRIEVKGQDISKIINLAISFYEKEAIYFFTTKFSLKKDSNLKSGLITANITQPINTEIKFGITDKNSSDWKDYSIIPINKFFDITNLNLNKIKVGIKTIAYDTSISDISDFSLIFSGDKSNVLSNSN